MGRRPRGRQRTLPPALTLAAGEATGVTASATGGRGVGGLPARRDLAPHPRAARPPARLG